MLPLQDLVVVDASASVAGQFAGKLFAGFGAAVTLVEPLGGTPTRRLPPLRPATASPEAGADVGGPWSYLFEHLNGAKGSLELADADADDERLAALVATADVVIRDGDLAWLPALASGVVDCVVTDFPATGAYARWRSTEMIQQALSGSMYLTGARHRTPLYGMGRRSSYAAGTTAFISAMAALVERHRSGRGQRVSTSVFEAVAAMGENLVSLYSYSGAQPERVPPAMLATLRCRDGWVVVYALVVWSRLCEVFGADALAADERFVSSKARMAHWPEAIEALSGYAAKLTTAEVAQRSQERKILCETVTSLADLVASPQWRARHMVVTHPPALLARRGSPIGHALGPVFRVDGGGYVAEPAPALGVGRAGNPPIAPAAPAPSGVVGSTRVGVAAAEGEVADDDEVLRGERALGGAGRSGPPVGNRSGGVPSDPTGTHGEARTPASLEASARPLAGIRVIDLTTAWAGPMATRCLAFLGAEVIKVEVPSRLDAWRGMYLGKHAPLYPKWTAGERRWDRCCSFNTQGHDKASLGLDITAPGGADVLADLLRRSDVLIANFSSGVLDRLGFGCEAVAAINPAVVVVEMPAFGKGGPAAGHVAMGSTMEAACGMAGLLGYGDEDDAAVAGGPVGTTPPDPAGPRPYNTGSTILDPIGGLTAAAATLVGLHQRAATGRGCAIEVAQTECGAHWIGEHLLAELDGHPAPTAQGNVVSYAEPHDAFACRGHDEWVAIAVRDDEEWAGLCATIGEPALVADERFATFDARRSHRGELADIIGRWTGRRTKVDAAAQCQAHGVPAAPLNRGVDVFFDPTLRQNGFMVGLDHPEAGWAEYPSLAFHLARTPGAIERPAPCFGQDNRRILTVLLGYDEGRIAELCEARTVSDEPYVKGRK